MTEDFIPIAFFIMVVVIIKIISDNKIRRLAIEKGLVDQNLRSLFEARFDAQIPAALKWGFVLVGIGLAIVIGRMFPDEMTEQVTIGCMFLFAGLGLIIYYFFAVKRMKKAKEEETSLKQ